MSQLRPALHGAALLLALCLTACASSFNGEPDSRPVRVAGMAKPLAHGDCPAARRLAAETPDLAVDRLPTPIKYEPPPVPKTIPPGVGGRNGRANIRIEVIVDTLGRADMSTFRVVKSTSPWMTRHVRSAVARWRFTPAELAGCKVPRLFWFEGKITAPKSTASPTSQ